MSNRKSPVYLFGHCFNYQSRAYINVKRATTGRVERLFPPNAAKNYLHLNTTAGMQQALPDKETQPKPAETVKTTTPKSGRHSPFTCNEYLVIVREVAAAKGNIAGFSETRNEFKTVAGHVSQNTFMSQKVTYKIVQDPTSACTLRQVF